MKPAASSPPPSVSAVADRVRTLLDAKQWRKARDEAKQGCKADKAKFLPLLIEANTGLTREMIAKKQISEAEQVLAYLATIAPKEFVDELKKEMLGQKEVQLAQQSVVRPQGAGAARVPTVEEVAGLAARLGSGEELAASDWSRVDAWVADGLGRNLPAPKGEVPQVVQDMTAVSRAIDAVGAGNFSEAQDLLRPLSLRSLLQHWKAFLRAVIFSHQGEREKALRGFRSLEPSSLLSRASAPYLALLKEPIPLESKPSDEQLAFGLLALSGGDPGWAGAVAKAESHWDKGEVCRVYRDLRKGAKGKFPTIVANAAGTLTDLVFCTQQVNDDRRDQLLAAVIADLPRAHTRTHETLALLRCVMLNLDFLKESDISLLFELYLKLWKNEGGLPPQTEALAREWMGTKWADEAVVPSMRIPGRFEVLVRNPIAAQAEFEKAIKLQPGRVKSYLGLCRIFERTGEMARREKLLAEMCQRFEDDKSVMMLAGESDLGLKKFASAVVHLEKALRLDPLDTRLLDEVVFAKAGQILEAGGSAPRDGWALLEPLLVDEPKVQARSRWCMRVIQGAGQRRGLSANLREEGSQMAPHPLVAVYFERLACLCFALPVPKDSGPRWKAVLPSVKADTIIQLLDVYEYWVVRHKASGTRSQVRGALESAIPALNTKHATPEALLQLTDALVSRVTKDKKDLQFAELCDYLIFLLHQRHLSKCHKRKADPRLRLAVALLDDLRCFNGTIYDPLSYLQDLAKDAAAAGLPVVAERARKLLHKVKEFHFSRRPEFDDPFVEVIRPGPDSLPESKPGPSFEDLRGFMDIILQIKASLPQDVADMRKMVVREKVIPVATFDMLVDFARNATAEELAGMMTGMDGYEGGPAYRPGQPKGRGKTSHPDQLDLF
ncbi:tetratricopeptide repeat protein [Verrucomicrobium spinosum]|uniref:tetratricopeptide repeat protein n=1 Tax=Verrucomicrobium spinosum TaxID=2736 RepID=UPI0012F6D2C4|nr:hypothetical protein [Verrucomicrobium spinosum]